MRRSQAPSRFGKGVAIERPLAGKCATQKECTTNSGPRYAVLLGRPSNRKHKRWDNDGTLHLHNNGTATIQYTIDGSEKCIRSKCATVQVGQVLRLAGYEVLIVEASSSPNNCERVPLVPSSSCEQKDPLVSSSSTRLVSSTPDEGTFSVDNYWLTRLRPHQVEGVQFLYRCITATNGFDGYGAILADEMGLGKSLQCVALVLSMMNSSKGNFHLNRVLLLAPCSLLENWRNEFDKWTTGARHLRANVRLIRSTKMITPALCTLRRLVLIVGHELFLRNASTFQRYNFDLLICDEAHKLKNTLAKSTCALRRFPIRRRILLTGTPIQNNLGELYSICDLANPNSLGTPSEFRVCYERPIMQSNVCDDDEQLGNSAYGLFKRKELAALLCRFMLRRPQELNASYLPKKVDYVVFCKASALQCVVYSHIVEFAKRALSNEIGACADWHLLVLDAMRKLCNHPAIVKYSCRDALDKRSEPASFERNVHDCVIEAFHQVGYGRDVRVQDCGKMLVLANFLQRVRQSYPDQKVVIASNYTETLNMIEAYCASAGYTFYRLDGGTNPLQRQKFVDHFNLATNDTFLFLLSTKAGGMGLNLIGASRLVIYDLDWNPAYDKQAMARIWRDGQTRVCHVYRLITTGTIEECIFQRQMKKDEIAMVGDGVIADWSESIRKMSLEDLKLVLSLNLNTNCATHDRIQCQCIGSSGTPKEQCDWRHTVGEFLDNQSPLDSCLGTFDGSVTFLFHR